MRRNVLLYFGTLIRTNANSIKVGRISCVMNFGCILCLSMFANFTIQTGEIYIAATACHISCHTLAPFMCLNNLPTLPPVPFWYLFVHWYSVAFVAMCIMVSRTKLNALSHCIAEEKRKFRTILDARFHSK